MLAEITSKLPDPNHFASIGWVCVSIVAIIAGVRQVIGLWNDVKQKPSGAEALAEVAKSFASKEEVGRLERELAFLRAERKTDVSLLHEKIDLLQKDMAAVQASDEHTSNQLTHLQQSVESMPATIITTLKNTGAI